MNLKDLSTKRLEEALKFGRVTYEDGRVEAVTTTAVLNLAKDIITSKVPLSKIDFSTKNNTPAEFINPLAQFINPLREDRPIGMIERERKEAELLAKYEDNDD